MLALGVYPEITLSDARHKRDQARKLVAAGTDPSEYKKAVKVEQQSAANSFETVARAWHGSNKKWSASHSARVLKTLVDHLFPSIGHRNIADLKTRDLLTPIKVVEHSGRLEVAARLQQRTTAIMRYAVQSGMIDYNPAQTSVIHELNHLFNNIEPFSTRGLEGKFAHAKESLKSKNFDFDRALKSLMKNQELF
ncbi:hypothetical protein Rin_00018110 [Candidatus Regiella insecticola 5.15]|uniref:Core-binding (CB) domain-containing protein n=1 Tax=Candidatus Regiella insecticola 5.15 TaxID=1005043 RepID=G2H173_9ENTR|nr:hypothetical protein Rin_00018110 [Candidatus Regiella insecticola 5.15]